MITRLITFALCVGVAFTGASAETQLLDPLSAVIEPAPARFNEVDGQIRSEMQRARSLVNQGQWDSAVETIRGLIDQHGQQLAALDPPTVRFRRHVELRFVLQRLLCQLDGDAASARDLYRNRSDAVAQDFYQTGIDRRDPTRLAQVVGDFFASRWGDNAAFALGEHALEAGDYALARYYWRMLLPDVRKSADDAAVVAGWLTYPDSEISAAEIQARLILVSILESDTQRAAAEFQTLKLASPQASGRIAGRQVVLVDALADLLQQAEQWPPPRSISGWPTFAGSFDRQSQLPALGMIGPQPVWRIPLQRVNGFDKPAAARLAAPAVPATDTVSSLCSYFPIVVEDYLLIASSNDLRCFHVSSGRPVSWADDAMGRIYSVPSRPQESNRGRVFGVPRFTLSSEGQRVFVVQGDATGYRVHSDTDTSSWLIGLDLQTEGRMLFPPTPPPHKNWAFEGAPVVHGSDLFVCLRENGDVPALHVACLRGGDWRWTRRVAYGDPIGAGQVNRFRNLLLTLVGQTLYLNSNLGFVAALDANDGRTRWMTQYPRSTRRSADPSERAWQLYRDPTPCLYHHGQLFVAPNDFAGLMALDASDGHVIWEFDDSVRQFDGIHLLGITRNRLVVSGRRLWWLNASDGSLCNDVASNPFPSNTDAAMLGFGRGLLTDSEVVWPADAEQGRVFVFSSESGHLTRQPLNLRAVDTSAGNLLATPQLLIVAGPDEVVAFRRIESRP